MKYRVMYTPLAKEDLKAIYRYLARNRKLLQNLSTESEKAFVL